MYMKNRSLTAARLLPPVALFVALLLFLCSCQSPGTSAETASKGETSVPTETAAPTQAVTTGPETEVPSADRTGEEIYLSHPELTPVNYDSPALLPLTEDAGQDYLDTITFLCDSPFYWVKLHALLSGGVETTQIWTGPEGTMTLGYHHGFEMLDPFDGALRTIPDAAELHRPPVLVITVGINGVALWDEETFKAEYTDLIEEIRTASPDTVIIAQSILPISTWYYNWGMFTNEKITAANAWILEVAEQCGIHYLDTYSALAGEDGSLRPEFAEETDGLHPNAAGLSAALAYIRTHAYVSTEGAGDVQGP